MISQILTENKEQVIEMIIAKKWASVNTAEEFIKCMENEIADFDYDEEENEMYNLQNVADWCFVNKMSASAQAKIAKDNNPNSLRNIMGRSAIRNEDAGKTWNPILKEWI